MYRIGYWGADYGLWCGGGLVTGDNPYPSPPVPGGGIKGGGSLSD